MGVQGASARESQFTEQYKSITGRDKGQKANVSSADTRREQDNGRANGESTENSKREHEGGTLDERKG